MKKPGSKSSDDESDDGPGPDPGSYDMTLPASAFADASGSFGKDEDPLKTVPPPKKMPKLEPATEAPVIADVTVTEQLGRGGQGVVFRGFQEFLQREVAVKVLHRSVDRDLARFQKEATLLASLQHPNIVGCYQAGVGEDGECYMVLEFVNGPDLFEYVKTHGALEEDMALALASDVAQGLQHGYEQSARMIHRDVKPQNILIQKPSSGSGPALRAKVVDLGLARCLEESMELTRPGAVMGTPVSMAPEQFDNPGDVDHRTDIYGLGCVIFYSLTGDPAFKGATLTAIYRQKTAHKSAKPHKDLDLHPGTRALLDKMLAPEQEKRHADYGELLEEISEVRRALKAERSGGASNGSKPWLWPAIGAGALALGLIGYLVTAGGEDGSPDGTGGQQGASAETLGNTAGKISGGHLDTDTPPRGDTPGEDDPEEILGGADAPAPDTPSDREGPGAPDDGPGAEPSFDVPPPLPTPVPGAPLVLLDPADPSPKWMRALGGGVEFEGLAWSASGWSPGSSLEVGQSNKFKDPRREDQTAEEFVKAMRGNYGGGAPVPFFLPWEGSLAHPVPAGPWTLEGDLALCRRSPRPDLLGGLVFHRADGSYLELLVGNYLAENVEASERGSKALPKTSQCLVRAIWFDRDGGPLLPGEIHLGGKKGDSPKGRSGPLLGGRGGQLLLDREVVALTFRLVVDAQGNVEGWLGDDRNLFLKPPPDLASNPIRQVTAFAQVGDVRLRRWSFASPE